jgi:hypothetical protein
MKQHLDSPHALQRVAKWIHCGKAPLLAVLLIVSVSSAWAKLPGENDSRRDSEINVAVREDA